MTERPENVIKTYIAEITEDPTLSFNPGDQLRFVSRPFPIDNQITFNTLNNCEFFEGALLTIHFKSAEAYEIVGSGYMIGPGLAITAKHIFQSCVDRIENGHVGAVCMGFRENKLCIWRIRTIVNHNHSDLAILCLQAASPLEAKYVSFALSTRMPSVGEELVMAGFRRAEVAHSHQLFSVTGHTFISSGAVTKQYPRQRDSVMLPWPVLEVDCRTVGGMSGGPVLDKYGYCVGVVTSGISDSNDEGPTYVSMLWPVLSCKFQPNWPRSFFSEKVCLLNMGQKFVRIEGRHAITWNSDDGRSMYQPWS